MLLEKYFCSYLIIHFSPNSGEFQATDFIDFSDPLEVQVSQLTWINPQAHKLETHYQSVKTEPDWNQSNKSSLVLYMLFRMTMNWVITPVYQPGTHK